MLNNLFNLLAVVFSIFEIYKIISYKRILIMDQDYVYWFLSSKGYSQHNDTWHSMLSGLYVCWILYGIINYPQIMYYLLVLCGVSLLQIVISQRRFLKLIIGSIITLVTLTVIIVKNYSHI